MLEDLTIRDFALIDGASLEFNGGFTVLSGETGAGKSMLIGALTFLLGGKSGADLVRAGAQEASVSGTFFLGPRRSPPRELGEGDEPADAYEWLDSRGIADEDGRILIRRYVRATGKSGAWVGDTPVTRAELSDFCSHLVDIHGQHEHQNLMKVAGHRRYLDSYAGLTERVRAFTALFTELAGLRERLSRLVEESRGRAERMELLSFAVKEISEAKLRAGEDEELADEEARLSSFERLYGEVESVRAAFGGGDGDGILPSLKRARAAASRAAALDRSLENLSQRLDGAFYELEDIAGEFHSYAHSLVFDPARLAEVQERQTLLYALKKKYASSPSAPVGEVIAHLAEAQAKLEELGGSEESQAALRGEIAGLEKRVYAEARAISAARKDAAARMSAAVVGVLSRLGMANTRFLVSVREKAGTDDTQRVGAYGLDDVEFLISANPGQPLQPLAKIASGGELSRVMLSLKTILASSDTVGTMLFDEIDTGIGGEVAVSVGSHLRALARERQVLCITHLASIAVYADNQIRIQKGVSDGATRTTARPIVGEERVAEIARMLSGDAEGAESLGHARAMLEKFSGGVTTDG